MSRPSNRCDHVFDAGADLYKAHCCWREAWQGGKCVWHAAVWQKPTKLLRPARVAGTASEPAAPGDRWVGRGGERLDRAILRDADLTGMQFRGCTFFGADLSKATLSGVDCSRADFRRADLSEAEAGQAVLEGCVFKNADLSGADLRGANVVDADLREANLRGADLGDANLRGADLRRANLQGANLQGADLPGAQCYDANFADASVVEADLQGANLESTTMSGVHAMRVDLRDAKLADADCTDANLTRSTLSEAVCRGTDFTNADLEAADLTELHAARATFEDAILERARLNRADLYDADLSGARFYGAVFGGAQVNEGTVLDRHVAYDPTEEGEIAADGGGDTVDDLTKAAGTYRIVQGLARENELDDLRTHSDLRRRDLRRRRYRRDGQWGKWVRSKFASVTVRYGESPGRVVAAATAVVLLCGLLYPLRMLELPDGTLLQYPSTPAEAASVLGESLYFSAVTFATGSTAHTAVGVGRVLAAFENVAGVVLFALLVYAFARRATK